MALRGDAKGQRRKAARPPKSKNASRKRGYQPPLVRRLGQASKDFWCD